MKFFFYGDSGNIDFFDILSIMDVLGHPDLRTIFDFFSAFSEAFVLHIDEL